MDWKTVKDELRRLNETTQSNSLESSPEPKENPQKLEDVGPKQKWYQIADVFSNQDELLRAILGQLQEMQNLVQQPAPAPEYEPPKVFPPGLEAKIEVIAREQTKTKELLEGFNFVNGQASISTPGTPTEVVSAVKTYLTVIRANTTNAGDIFVGGAGVSATSGFILGAGESLTMQIDNNKKSIRLDADTAGDGVSWIALIE